MQYQKTSETLQKKKRKEEELYAYTISFSLSTHASVLLSCSSMCCSCLPRHTSSPDEFSCSSLLPVYVPFHVSTPKRPFPFPTQVLPLPIVSSRGICKFSKSVLSGYLIIHRKPLLGLYQHQRYCDTVRTSSALSAFGPSRQHRIENISTSCPRCVPLLSLVIRLSDRGHGPPCSQTSGFSRLGRVVCPDTSLLFDIGVLHLSHQQHYSFTRLLLALVSVFSCCWPFLAHTRSLLLSVTLPSLQLLFALYFQRQPQTLSKRSPFLHRTVHDLLSSHCASPSLIPLCSPFLHRAVWQPSLQYSLLPVLQTPDSLRRIVMECKAQGQSSHSLPFIYS